MPARPSGDQPRLSIINEDSDVLPPLPSSPPTASHRPFSRRWRDKPPAANYDLSPPKYSVWDVSGPRGEKLMDMRNNRYIARRGGWKRVCLIFLVIAAVAIALGVGLGVGLQRRGGDDSSAGASEAAVNNPEPFPVGSYNISTNLSTSSTSCTAIHETWECHTDLTIFHWIIQGPPDNLTISSSLNPFAIYFSDVPLSLEDAGTEDERYYFSTLIDKVVYPQRSITDDSRSATCYFNATQFTASLYLTRDAPTSSSIGNITDNDTSSVWQEWLGSVEINQSITGGENVPNCYLSEGGAPGPRISDNLPIQPGDQSCTCNWRTL